MPAQDGDPNILNLPAHSTGLGRGVASPGYGSPSKFEANVQRRPSPSLTQTTQPSVSFAPLQSLFGIVTPSGLHFERHYQGWWDIDPTKHRSMINGSSPELLKKPMVFTMGELMRLTHSASAPKVASVLPDFALNANGNLARQNRLVGAQHAIDTSRFDAKTGPAAAGAPEKRASDAGQ